MGLSPRTISLIFDLSWSVHSILYNYTGKNYNSLHIYSFSSDMREIWSSKFHLPGGFLIDNSSIVLSVCQLVLLPSSAVNSVCISRPATSEPVSQWNCLHNPCKNSLHLPGSITMPTTPWGTWGTWVYKSGSRLLPPLEYEDHVNRISQADLIWNILILLESRW